MHHLLVLPVCFQDQHASSLTSFNLLFTNTQTNKQAAQINQHEEQRASQTHQDILDKHYVHKWTQIVSWKKKGGNCSERRSKKK